VTIPLHHVGGRARAPAHDRCHDRQGCPAFEQARTGGVSQVAAGFYRGHCATDRQRIATDSDNRADVTSRNATTVASEAHRYSPKWRQIELLVAPRCISATRRSRSRRWSANYGSSTDARRSGGNDRVSCLGWRGPLHPARLAPLALAPFRSPWLLEQARAPPRPLLRERLIVAGSTATLALTSELGEDTGKYTREQVSCPPDRFPGHDMR
jgi:hypothetical protein